MNYTYEYFISYKLSAERGYNTGGDGYFFFKWSTPITSESITQLKDIVAKNSKGDYPRPGINLTITCLSLISIVDEYGDFVYPPVPPVDGGNNQWS